MFKKLSLSMVLALLGACASRAPEPAPAPDTVPPPVEITEAPEPAPPPAAEPPPPTDTPQKPAQGDGIFRIAIASLDRAELTAPWVQKAEAAGYRTEVLAVDIDGRTWHRVLLPGYASLAEAQAALPFIQQDLGAPGAWVTSRRRAPTPDGAPAPTDAPPPPPPEPAPAN